MSVYRVDTDIWSPGQLLLALWHGSKPAVLFKLADEEPPSEPSLDELEDIIKTGINYINGRAIKIDFSTWPVIDYTKYDEYNGKNSFIDIVNDPIPHIKRYDEKVLHAISDHLHNELNEHIENNYETTEEKLTWWNEPLDKCTGITILTTFMVGLYAVILSNGVILD